MCLAQIYLAPAQTTEVARLCASADSRKYSDPPKQTVSVSAIHSLASIAKFTTRPWVHRNGGRRHDKIAQRIRLENSSETIWAIKRGLYISPPILCPWKAVTIECSAATSSHGAANESANCAECNRKVCLPSEPRYEYRPLKAVLHHLPRLIVTISLSWEVRRSVSPCTARQAVGGMAGQGRCKSRWRG